MQSSRRIIALFDVDQTLTPARKTIENIMIDTLDRCMAKGIAIGIVSGSDLHKIKEQVGDDLVARSDYTFSENGLYALKRG